MWWRSRRARLAELDAEIRAHLQLAIEDRIARGESPGDAERHARRQFGHATTIREVTGDMLPELWFGQALRHAVRSLMRAPAFTISAALTLVVGMGAMTAMFAIVYGVLLAPLPYGNPGRLVSVWHETKLPVSRRSQMSPGSYFTYRRFATSIDGIAIYRTGTGNIWAPGGESEPEQVDASWISASTIPLLGIQPLVGRGLTAKEDVPGGPNLAIISERMWRDRFGGRGDVLGKKLYVNDVAREIIGVMPARFRFPAPSTQVWLPVRADPNTTNAGDLGFSITARLRPGITPDAAQRDFAAALPRIAEFFPEFEPQVSTRTWLDQAKPSPVVMPLSDDITGGIAATLWILAGAAGLVLLVACANVSNLLMIRADGRQLELAVRAALGASRARVMAPIVAEAVVLVAVAGALSLVVAWAAVRMLVAFGPPDIPRLAELHAGVPAAAFSVVACVAVAVLTAVVPVARAWRIASFAALREGGRGSASAAQQRLRGTIAALQIALAVVVLAGSGLLLRTFQQLHRQRAGFDATNVGTLWVQLPFARFDPTDTGVVRFYSRLTDRLSAVPGVRAAGISSGLPLTSRATNLISFAVEGGSGPLPARAALQRYMIDGGYFSAMGIRLIAGHTFAHLDVQREAEAIVSRQVSEELWRDSSGNAALGKRLRRVAGGPWYTIIGVADDVRDRDLSLPPMPTVYFPQVPAADNVVGQRPQRSMAVIVRTTGSPAAAVASAKRIMRELDPTLPAFGVESMEDIVRASTARLSLMLILVGTAAVITLLLGAIGLYGVVSYVVMLRRRELGIRVALGADPRRLAMTITGQGMKVAAAGGVAGLVAFTLVARLMRAFLFGVTTADPAALLGATAVSLLTAGIASWLPARRAATIDPAATLRAE